MKVLDLAFDEKQLEIFSQDAFYSTNKEFLIEDYQRLFSQFLEIELPAEITEAQQKTIITQKTDNFIAFVVGHLNFLDLGSALTASLHQVEKPKSNLILPPSMR